MASLVLFQSLIGRLKTRFTLLVCVLSGSFQSLIGRLKTIAELMGRYKELMFQSLIGRLKTLRKFIIHYCFNYVSIPYR